MANRRETKGKIQLPDLPRCPFKYPILVTELNPFFNILYPFSRFLGYSTGLLEHHPKYLKAQRLLVFLIVSERLIDLSHFYFAKFYICYLTCLRGGNKYYFINFDMVFIKKKISIYNILKIVMSYNDNQQPIASLLI